MRILIAEYKLEFSKHQTYKYLNILQVSISFWLQKQQNKFTLNSQSGCSSFMTACHHVFIPRLFYFKVSWFLVTSKLCDCLWISVCFCLCVTTWVCMWFFFFLKGTSLDNRLSQITVSLMIICIWKGLNSWKLKCGFQQSWNIPRGGCVYVCVFERESERESMHTHTCTSYHCDNNSL